MKRVEIGTRLVGEDCPCYVVAELSANHHQQFDEAVRLVEAAAAAGADAVKLQTYTPDTLTLDSDLAHFRIQGTIWDGRKLHDLYSEAYTPWDWHPKLKQLAAELGIDFFSTPFDETAVEFLEELGVVCHKVSSFELTHLPLLERVAASGRPVILSTGMASLEEIDEAVNTMRAAGGKELVLLKCTSAYPAPAAEANLLTIRHLAETFGVPSGLSDHTTGIAVPVAAVALGACVIEKHLTRSRDVPGPDSSFSLEPDEFAAMVRAVRKAEAALGRVSYELTPKQVESKAFRRSVFAVASIGAGEELTSENIRVLRPSTGLEPKYYKDILGKLAAENITEGTPITWSLLRHERA